MKVTSLVIESTSGANKQPHSGSATFDDGRSFDWMRDPTTGSYIFHTYMKQSVGSVMKSFRSPKRNDALAARLNA